MNKTFIVIFETVIVLGVIIGAIALVLSTWGHDAYNQQQQTFDNCCNGSPCSDTYWNGTACVSTIGQDTNWIPIQFSSWWLPLTAVFSAAAILTLVVYFITPNEVTEERRLLK